MQRSYRNVSITFTAGLLGAFFLSSLQWILNAADLSSISGVIIARPIALKTFYENLLVGGLWGFIFMIPLLQSASFFIRGLLFSLIPTAYVLLIGSPISLNFEVITQTQMIVISKVFIENMIWAIVASFWIDLCD